MEDAFNLGVMPRAAVQKWANELYPDIAQLFPFQGVVRFKAHFGNGIAVAITDEGMPGTIFAGGQVQADDPEIAEVLRVFASDSAPTFSQMYAVLGDKYFNFTRFTYAGPYRGGDSGYEVYAAFLADWVESCVLPRVLELNRSRVMRAISSNRLMQMSKTLQYDIAISFAGEDRVLAESIAGELKNRSVRVFYDEFEKATLWGKDLFQHLRTVYRDKARFCIILVSAHYGAKHWTRHELKNAQERAFLQDEEYILPVRIDDTELPGMNSTTGYLDARNNSVDQIVDLAIQKLAIGKVATNAVELPQGPIKGPSNHRVAPSTTVNDPSSSFTSIESTVFFADRFAQAFPGVRGIAWFGSADDVQQRL
ncbi:MAG: toll/interleukin-1 receptor domain-containing protein, partial [Alphaproteobacteria bacterium]